MSLLRSEQATEKPIVGNPTEFEQLLRSDARLLDWAEVRGIFDLRGSYWSTLKWAFKITVSSNLEFHGIRDCCDVLIR